MNLELIDMIFFISSFRRRQYIDCDFPLNYIKNWGIERGNKRTQCFFFSFDYAFDLWFFFDELEQIEQISLQTQYSIWFQFKIQRWNRLHKSRKFNQNNDVHKFHSQKKIASHHQRLHKCCVIDAQMMFMWKKQILHYKLNDEFTEKG